MVISPYYYGILKRSIQEILDGSGVLLDPQHVTKDGSRGMIEYISYKVNWQAKGSVDADHALEFASYLQLASAMTKMLNNQHIEINYLIDVPESRCVTDDTDLCKRFLLNKNIEKLTAFLTDSIPSQEEYQV